MAYFTQRWMSRTPLLAIMLVIGLLAGISGSSVADADTTVQPSGPGAIAPDAEYLVRDSSATIDVTPSALMYSRATASANFTLTAPALAACRGDQGAIGVVGAGNNSPRTEVTVEGPAGFTPVSFLSPSREVGLFTGPFQMPTPYQPLASQAGGAGVYRGGVPPANSALGSTAVPNPGVGYQATLDLANKPAGVYTVTTVHKEIVRTGVSSSSPCIIGYPTQNGFNATTPIATPKFGTTFTPGLRTVVHKFEYRPWQQEFKDVLGNGGVNFNTVPAESQFTIKPTSGPAKFSTISSQGTYNFYSLPSSASFLLPSNPQDCVEDLASCLGPLVEKCDPSSGCVPRIVAVNRHDGNEGLAGVFDLDSRAFIAEAKTGGSTRTLFSLGTSLDAVYRDTLTGLETQADKSGVDIGTLLATQVVLRSDNYAANISLLNGLQIDPRLAGRNGIEIVSDFKIQAGFIIHTYALTSPGACVLRSKSSAAGDQSFKKSVKLGMDVAGTPISIPTTTVPGVPIPLGGQVYLIQGNMNGPGTNASILAALGVDVDHGAPTGLPFWLLPTDGLLRTHSAKYFNYIGTATWSATETPAGSSCIVSGGFTGIGVMIDNPPARLPVAKLLAGVNNPQVNALLNQIVAAAVAAGAPVTGDATVASLLTALTTTALGALF